MIDYILLVSRIFNLSVVVYLTNNLVLLITELRFIDRRSGSQRLRKRYRRIWCDRVRFTDVFIESLSELLHMCGVWRLMELFMSFRVCVLYSRRTIIIFFSKIRFIVQWNVMFIR